MTALPKWITNDLLDEILCAGVEVTDGAPCLVMRRILERAAEAAPTREDAKCGYCFDQIARPVSGGVWTKVDPDPDVSASRCPESPTGKHSPEAAPAAEPEPSSLEPLDRYRVRAERREAGLCEWCGKARHEGTTRECFFEFKP